MTKEFAQNQSESDVPLSSLESTPVAETPPQQVHRPELQRRLDRVAAYATASLAKRNSLLAALGSANSGLMTLNLYLEESLVQALATGPTSVEQLEKLQPSIDMYLRVTRQIDRFAQLEIKSKSRRSAPSDSAHRKNDASAMQE